MNVLVVTYWDRDDPLVVNYTLPYLRIMQRELPPGSKIHLVTLDKEVGMSGEEDADGFIRHGYPYKGFGLAGVGMVLSLVWSLVRLVRRNRIDVVHAWCTPAGMVGYLVSKITGKPLVLDSYEPHAESMVENGTWKRGSVAFRTLFLFEKLQTWRAVAVIAATEGMRAYAQAKYQCVPARFHVKPACVDLKRFDPAVVDKESVRRSMGLEGKLVAVYAGKFGGIYLDREVFELFLAARNHWGDQFHVLLLTGHRMDELLPWMQAFHLPPEMFTVQWAAPKDVPTLLGLADWAITPVKPVPTKRYCTPVKDGEYWAMGLPVMITAGISDDSGIISRNGAGVVIRTLGPSGYNEAVLEMADLLERGGEGLRPRIRSLAMRYRNFNVAEEVYRKVYGEVLASLRN
jgi:glycosyltransferase involved in cell wall biosynthesis